MKAAMFCAVSRLPEMGQKGNRQCALGAQRLTSEPLTELLAVGTGAFMLRALFRAIVLPRLSANTS